jgi:hypothetical protein
VWLGGATLPVGVCHGFADGPCFSDLGDLTDRVKRGVGKAKVVALDQTIGQLDFQVSSPEIPACRSWALTLLATDSGVSDFERSMGDSHPTSSVQHIMPFASLASHPATVAAAVATLSSKSRIFGAFKISPSL